jgi:peptidoglycan/LPS O-acetylase OafA/YrhL
MMIKAYFCRNHEHNRLLINESPCQQAPGSVKWKHIPMKPISQILIYKHQSIIKHKKFHMQSRENNLNILRLIAAILVIVNHGYGFEGYEADPLKKLTGDLSIGNLGVLIFFLISGYLITQSWIKNPEPSYFMLNRVLRIYPALICVVLVSVFLVGPAFTSLSISAYFSDPATYEYLWNLSLLKMKLTLPGVFDGKGTPHIVNLPLWTLVFEFSMYIVALVLGLAGLLTSHSRKALVLWFLFIVANVYYMTHIPLNLYILKINVNYFTLFFIYFFGGALYFLYQHKIPMKPAILAMLAVLWLFSFRSIAFSLVSFLFISYSVFFMGFHMKQFGLFVTRHGDYSYGTYLYGYIVQNILYHFFADRLGLFTGIVASLLLVLPVAMLSWHLVESKAIKLKRYLGNT